MERVTTVRVLAKMPADLHTSKRTATWRATWQRAPHASMASMDKRNEFRGVLFRRFRIPPSALSVFMRAVATKGGERFRDKG